MKDDYFARFEGITIALMSAAILLSLGAVILLVKTTFPSCSPSYYTYCGETEPDHH
jgi:hypothetical protein